MNLFSKILSHKKLTIPLVLFLVGLLVLNSIGTIFLFAASADKNEYFTVNSVMELKKVSPNSHSKVITTGYYHVGDQGSGTYYYDVSDKQSADNGGTVIVGKNGARWKLIYSGRVSLRQFGALGDGQTDDTEELQNWLNAISTGETGYAASGRYLFSKGLTSPLCNKVGITGDGSQQTVFVYNGAKTDIDLITFGTEISGLTGWTLRGFSVESDVKMTGGTALHIKRMRGGTRINDVSVSTLNTEKMIWDGIWFDRCNVTTYDGFEINVQNEGVVICGTPNDDSASDLSLDKGTITFSNIGIHAAGGFGGLYVGQVLIYGAKVGYLQDNARVNRGNREIVISNFCVLDACHKYNLQFNDPLSLLSSVQINAFITGAGWIVPAEPGDGIYIEKLPSGRVSISSPQIKNSTRHGINIKDASATLLISSATFIVDSGGWGIYSSVPDKNIHFDGVALYNKSGALTPNIINCKK